MIRLSFLKPGAVGLAPMAGVTDSSFRALCRRCGADWTVSEMISAKALTLGDQKTFRLMAFEPAERPFGLQLFGGDPAVMAEAARIVEERVNPDFIDLNMGCPAPKITKGTAGSALLREPEQAARVARAVAGAVGLPVTAKIRLGFDGVNALVTASMLEQAGVAAITIHGRTAAQMYRPPVDLASVEAVARTISIPLIGNGDIFSPRDAEKMLNTGCRAIMVGRAAMGNPFIFSELAAAREGRPYTPPGLPERLAALREQVSDMCKKKGEYIALREARKQAAWYIKGFRGAAELRAEACRLGTMADLGRFIESALERETAG